MKHLFSFFTYFAACLYLSTCHTTVLDAGNPRNRLFQQVVPGIQEEPSLVRLPRQNRFSSDDDNPVSNWGNFLPNSGGFDWGSSQNSMNDNPSNIIFVDDDFFNPQEPNNPPSISSTTRRPSSSTVAIPGMATTRSPCEDRCRATTQYDPVCGDNNVTYTNLNWLKCAQKCGRNVNVRYRGACPRVP